MEKRQGRCLKHVSIWTKEIIVDPNNGQNSAVISQPRLGREGREQVTTEGIEIILSKKKFHMFIVTEDEDASIYICQPLEKGPRLIYKQLG